MIKPFLTALTAAAVMTCVASVSYAQEFAADSTLRGEQLFPYDDQDPWKHGYIQVMPFYGGYHSFRPYNYKHVYAQSAQAQQWGIAAQAPYSQQFWHQYERRADLSVANSVGEASPLMNRVAPVTYQQVPAPVPPTVAGQTQVAPAVQPPLPAPGYAPHGYQQSPQYSGQVWGQPATR